MKNNIINDYSILSGECLKKEKEEVFKSNYKKIRLGVIMGGISSEREVSLMTGREIIKALELDNNVIIEEYVEGIEITVSILNGEVLPIIKIESAEGWFDFTSKYKSNRTIENVFNLPEKLEKKIKNISKKCWEKFKVEVYGRIDIILKNEDVYVLEINTLPGLTEKSLFPISAKEMGISYEELLDKIIQISLLKG